MLRVFCVLYFLLFAASVAGAQELEAGKPWYEKGRLALAEKDFATAITAFKKAFDLHYDNAKLHHAWGAALYQTKQYQEAGVHFRQALKDPAFAQLASLNLGLVALKQNNNEEAVAWFLEARKNGSSTKVAALAGEMLRRISYDREEAALAQASVVYFSIKSGYEDRAYSSALDEVGGSDQFLQLNFYGSKNLSGNANRGVAASINAFSLQNRYSKNTEVSVVSAKLGNYSKQDQWRMDSNIGVAAAYLAGEPYTTSINVDVDLRYNMNKTTTLGGSLAYESALAATDALDYATGDQVKGRIQLKHYSGPGTYFLTCLYEQNDRHDLADGADFYSYSPTRRSIQLQHHYRINDNWMSKLKLRFRHSEYADPHRIGGIVTLRVEDQTLSEIALGYFVSKHTTLLLALQHTDNNSSLDRYDYQRNEMTLGVEWLFL